MEVSVLNRNLQAASAKNAELLSILSQTDSAPAAHAQQIALIADLKASLLDARVRVSSLERALKNELRDHEKYNKSLMRRFAYKASGQGSKYDEKAGKEEREYLQAMKDAHDATKVRDGIEEMLAAATKSRDKLGVVAAKNESAQAELDRLYDALFEGPTPSVSGEDEGEMKRERARAECDAVRRKAEAEGTSANLLAEARKRFVSAMANVEDAVRHSTGGPMGGADSVGDVLERDALVRAEGDTKAARALAEQARRMAFQAAAVSGHHGLGGVGEVAALPVVRYEQGQAVSSSFWDNVFTDLTFHERVVRSKNELGVCGEVLEVELARAKERHEIALREWTTKATDLDDARRHLQRTRERAFAAAVSG